MNNAVQRALRGIALGRRNWTFAGSQRGADRAAIMLSVITTAVSMTSPKGMARRCVRPHRRSFRLHELLPWQWKTQKRTAIAAAA